MGTERFFVSVSATKLKLLWLKPFAVGGARRDRTADLYNAIVALSQLSYGPSKPDNISVNTQAVNTIVLAGCLSCRNKLKRLVDTRQGSLSTH